MGLFSLDWFKSNKKKDELEIKKLELEIRQQELAVQSEELYQNRLIQEKLEPKVDQNVEQLCADEFFSKMKPYLNVKLVNDVLTVVLLTGDVISKPGATALDFKKVRAAETEDEILDVISTPEVAQERKERKVIIEKQKAIIEGIDILKNLKDFEVKEDSVYFKGIGRSLPQLLIEELLVIVNKYKNEEDIDKFLVKDDEYQGLKRFFMWCCLNPRAEVANELYRFLKENSFRITKQGFFVALRNVVTVKTDGDTKIVDFVSNTYNKIKAVWKKKPDNYRVVRTNDGEYKFELVSAPLEDTIVGNLTTLYLDLPNMIDNRYTDDWTKTFDIRIGKLVSMPMEKCNWSTQDCAAAGLHFTSDQIHYVGCGDTSVLVLINPMKVVGIGQHKGRCYEYLPIMTVPCDEATSILHDLDFNTLELDEQYAVDELTDLTEKAKAGFAAESTKYSFNMPSISTQEIKGIVLSLDEMLNEIKGRVSSVDK